jgi:hypothetical protein
VAKVDSILCLKVPRWVKFCFAQVRRLTAIIMDCNRFMLNECNASQEEPSFRFITDCDEFTDGEEVINIIELSVSRSFGTRSPPW